MAMYEIVFSAGLFRRRFVRNELDSLKAHGYPIEYTETKGKGFGVHDFMIYCHSREAVAAVQDYVLELFS